MRLQMKMHLILCQHCRSFVKKLRLTKTVIAAVPYQAANEQQVAKIMTEITRIKPDS